MLFQKNIVKKYLAQMAEEQVSEAWEKYKAYFLNAEIQQNIRQSKEEQFQEGFLRELFVKVMGYTLNPSPGYNLITEQKNETDSKKADGAILLGGKVVGVIELKDHKTTDLSKVETQAFGYKSKHEGTQLVVISNFEKLRLYIDNAVNHEEWNLFTLSYEGFQRLYLCLAWPQVEQGIALRMKAESVSSEDQITNSLYRDYSRFKRELFADIVANNPYDNGASPIATGNDNDNSKGACPLVTSDVSDEREWQLLLFKKTQKLLDRLLFIFFAEDCGLLPPNSMVQIIDQWEQLKDMDEYRPFYDRVKKYFGYMNTGFKGKHYEIFAYNGGLFKPDEVLDSITISDELLVEHTRRLSTYDFESDVDVNILGHIFENSLSEIEEVTQSIMGNASGPLANNAGEPPALPSKRKQDGVFYTPQYITKYIVENTVGRLCSEKKLELNIREEEYFSDQRRQMQTKRRLLDQLQQYREWLLQITILDPACGSGAFLNAALQFLMAEHKLIDEMEAKITGSTIEFKGVENSILENNLFGVDINEESVEIAQLALWLRTAKPHRKLSSLNQNIKCGNSLINNGARPLVNNGNNNEARPFVNNSDAINNGASPIATITGDTRSFVWEKEFPRVFRLKEKRVWHIVTATHDSRTSLRMEEKHVRELRYHGTKPDADPVILSEQEELLVCRIIDEIAREDSLNIVAFNICRDHFHLLLVCEEREVSKIVGKIKSKTAIAINKSRDASTMTTTTARGLAPLSPTMSPPLSTAPPVSRSIWTQKFGCNELTTREHLQQTIQYINSNRTKHGLSPLSCQHDGNIRNDNGNNKGASPLAAIVDYDTAFREEYEGGFDVVIGNPPYVSAKTQLASETMSTQRQQIIDSGRYSTLHQKWDLYIPFIELGIRHLCKDKGVCAMIVPFPLVNQLYAKKCREMLLGHYSLYELSDLRGTKVFDDATVTSTIFFVERSNREQIVDISKIEGGSLIKVFKKDIVSLLQDEESYVWNLDENTTRADRHKNMNRLGDFCYISKGMVLNSDEKSAKGAFKKEDLISLTRDEIHWREYVEAKDIDKYQINRIRYLEYDTDRSPAQLSRPTFRELYTCSKLLTNKIGELKAVVDENNLLCDQTNRICVLWKELHGVDNASINNSIKKFSKYTRRQLEDLSSSVSLLYILAILNSRYGNYLLNSIRGVGNIDINPEYLRQIPIPKMELCDETMGQTSGQTMGQTMGQTRGQAPLLSSHDDAITVAMGLAPLSIPSLASRMLSLHADLQKKRSQFLRRLTENIEGVKINGALEQFDHLTFADFAKELKKQKHPLSLAQQDEWEEYFAARQQQCRELEQQIAATDCEIDLRVYRLYGLTHDEVLIVDPTTPITREQYEREQ